MVREIEIVEGCFPASNLGEFGVSQLVALAIGAKVRGARLGHDCLRVVD
jgi:hypothetical protein